MSYCSALKVPKSRLGDPFLSAQPGRHTGSPARLLAPGGRSRGRGSMTESAATWSVRASVSVTPRV